MPSQAMSKSEPAAASETEIITCLSVQQHYADDIFFNGKFAENRSWPTDHRGELFIHSSKIDETAVADILADEGYDYRKHSPTGLATGVILGRVNLVACVKSYVLGSIATPEVCKVIGRKPEQMPVLASHATEEIKQAEFLRELLKNINPICWRHWFGAEYVWIFTEAEMLDQLLPAKGRQRIWKMAASTESLALASRRKRSWKPKARLTKSAS